MPNLFGLDIAGIINRELGPGLLPLTLVRVSEGARNADPTQGLALTETSYTGRGFIEAWSVRQIGLDNGTGALIRVGDMKITLLGASLSVAPAVGDKVTIEGVTYRIEMIVSRDPAAATYVVNGRP